VEKPDLSTETPAQLAISLRASDSASADRCACLQIIYVYLLTNMAMTDRKLRPSTQCSMDSSILGASRRLGQDATNTMQQGC